MAKEDLSTLLELGSSEAIAFSVKEGISVGFVLQISVTSLVADQVTNVKVRGLEIVREIYIGTQQRKPESTAQKAFADSLSAE